MPGIYHSRPAAGAAKFPTIALRHMKPKFPPFSAVGSVLPLCTALWIAPFAAGAQYSLTWSTIDSGGGTSTGGAFTLSGTIGQPDAGLMSSGPFSLVGGFWGVGTAIQTPDAPTLLVEKVAWNIVRVSWSTSDPAWKLLVTANLSADWSEVSGPYPTEGCSFVVTASVTGPQKFYRLYKP
jgi:hypothetical protein